MAAHLVAAHTAVEHVISLPVGPAPYAAVVDTGGQRWRVDRHGYPVGAWGRPPREDASLQRRLGDAPSVPVPHLPGRPLPAPTGIRRDNPRLQGVIGLGDAIGWFAAHGFVVSVPLVDSQRYDLVIDGGVDLERVQVKTTTHDSPYGVPVVTLRTAGGNQSFHTRTPFDHTECELLYVLTGRGQRFVVPVSAFPGRSALNLGASMLQFQVR